MAGRWSVSKSDRCDPSSFLKGRSFSRLTRSRIAWFASGSEKKVQFAYEEIARHYGCAPQGLSRRQVGAALRMPYTMVTDYLARARRAGLSCSTQALNVLLLETIRLRRS